MLVVSSIILFVLIFVLIIVVVNKKNEDTKYNNVVVENKHSAKNVTQKSTLHQQRYYLEYRFIPKLIIDVLEKDAENAASHLYTVNSWRPIVESMVDGFEYDWENLKTDILMLDDKKEIVFFIFPIPQQVPDAAYGAVVIDRKTKCGNYYTLESSYGGEWVLGEIIIDKKEEGLHKNYGNLENPSCKSFLDWIRNRYVKSENVMNVSSENNSSKKLQSEDLFNKIEDVDDNNYKEFISKNSNVIILFYDLKGPSLSIKNIISELSTEYEEDLKIGKCDVYETEYVENIISVHNIRVLPTLFFYKNGEIVNKHIGITYKANLKEEIEKLIANN